MTRPRWKRDRLEAASPFRYERNPSFFVLTEESKGYPAGTWSDQGADDPEWRSGGLVKLLSYIRNETYGETIEYLLYRYGSVVDDELRLYVPRLEFNVDISVRIDELILEDYEDNYEYLKGRGISEDVQRKAGVKYDPRSKAVAFPWYTQAGRLANVKYRKTTSKIFWYTEGAAPIRELVYGIDQASRVTVICEAEIDALSFRQAGLSAVAVGGSSFNDIKRDIIRRSPIEVLVIATDNDRAGAKLRAEIVKSMRYVCNVRTADLSGFDGAKDANDILVKYGAKALLDVVKRSSEVSRINVNLDNFVK